MVKTHFKQQGVALSVVLLAAGLFFLAGCNNSSKGKETKDSVTVVKKDSNVIDNTKNKMGPDSLSNPDSTKGEQTPPPK